jgi:molybdenum cofactor cytidylyltransferase
MVTAIVLAAGESRRMGALKPLLPYGPGSVIQAVVRSVTASPVDRVLVVLGHRSDEIAADLAGTCAETLFNPRYPEGMLTSVQAGIAAAAPESEWLLIALGDQPTLRAETVRALLEEARSGGSGLVVPSDLNPRGHPLLIHAHYREEILALEGEGGLRQLFQRHPDEIAYVVVPDPDVLADMDTPEDYQRLLQQADSRPQRPPNTQH